MHVPDDIGLSHDDRARHDLDDPARDDLDVGLSDDD
jgi:hypothetical protein